MRYMKRFLVVVLVLVVGFSGKSYCENLVAVSCPELSVPPADCIFYEVNVTTGDVREVYRYKPDMPVTRVDIHPNFRDIAIWQSGFVKGKRETKVTSTNVGALSRPKSLCVEDKELRGHGFWYDDPTSGPQLAMSRGKDAFPTRIGPATPLEGNDSSLELGVDRILLTGDSYQTLGERVEVKCSRDGSDRLVLSLDASRARLSLSADVVAVLDTAKVRSLFVPCIDDRTIIVGASVALSGTERIPYLVYDRKTVSWWCLTGKGNVSVPRMFGKWIVVQEVVYSAAPVSDKTTGEFSFYTRDGKRSFSWIATSDPKEKQGTEVLAVWGDEIIFRRYSRIFRAEISGDKVVNEKLILDGTRLPLEAHYKQTYDPINCIHWVLRCPD